MIHPCCPGCKTPFSTDEHSDALPYIISRDPSCCGHSVCGSCIGAAHAEGLFGLYGPVCPVPGCSCELSPLDTELSTEDFTAAVKQCIGELKPNYTLLRAMRDSKCNHCHNASLLLFVDMPACPHPPQLGPSVHVDVKLLSAIICTVLLYLSACALLAVSM
jgi:hypothetical protein